MTPYFAAPSVQLFHGDCRAILPTLADGSVDCVVTSPPYFGLRDYGVIGQIGLEKNPGEYVGELVTVCREMRRALRSNGTLWLNLGDSFSSGNRNGHGSIVGYKQATNSASRNVRRPMKAEGVKDKDLLGIPWAVAFALRADGWYLRNDIIWAKPNAMAESVKDRPCRSHEYVFLLSKSQRYYSDFDAIKTPPRESSMIRLAQDVQSQAGSHRANGGAKTNGTMKAVGTDKQRGHSRRHAGFNDRWDKMERSEQQAAPATIRDVWFVPTASYKAAHFAVMAPEVARRCILAGCRPGGTVLDPFAGSGTTLQVASELGCKSIGIEANAEYCELVRKRIENVTPCIFSGANP